MMCVFIMPFYGKYKVIYHFEQRAIERIVDKIEINGTERKFDRPTLLDAIAVVMVANNDTLICKITLKGVTSDEQFHDSS